MSTEPNDPTNQIDLAHVPDVPESKTDRPDAPQYPELSIDNVSDPALLNLPEHGSSIIHHTIIEKKTHHRHGKTKHSIRMKIHSIGPHKAGKAHKHKMTPTQNDEAAIDAGLMNNMGPNPP